MNFSEMFHNSFSSVSPLKTEDELFKRVIERTENMENKKKISLRKPIVAACAVIMAVAAATVTAAAAGLINFNEIFGGAIKTQSNELGEKLIGNAADVKWSVSDDDYVVNLKGVTGTSDSLLAVIEITRADGKPVRNYLSNLDFLYERGFLTAFESVKLNDEFDNNGSGGCSTTINEAGNIEIRFSHSLTSVAGAKFELNCLGFYPTAEFNETHIDSFKILGMLGNSCEYYLDEIEKRALGKIELLDLSWSLEFTYTPSEASKTKIVVNNFNKPIRFGFDVSAVGGGEEEFKEFETAIEVIKADSIGIELKLSFVPEEYEAFWEYRFLPDSKKNEMKCINTDGTEIFLTPGAWSAGADESKYVVEMSLCYYDEKDVLATDISEIKAIVINGTTIELK